MAGIAQRSAEVLSTHCVQSVCASSPVMIFALRCRLALSARCGCVPLRPSPVAHVPANSLPLWLRAVMHLHLVPLSARVGPLFGLPRPRLLVTRLSVALPTVTNLACVPPLRLAVFAVPSPVPSGAHRPLFLPSRSVHAVLSHTPRSAGSSYYYPPQSAMRWFGGPLICTRFPALFRVRYRLCTGPIRLRFAMRIYPTASSKRSPAWSPFHVPVAVYPPFRSVCALLHRVCLTSVHRVACSSRRFQFRPLRRRALYALVPFAFLPLLVYLHTPPFLLHRFAHFASLSSH